MDELIICVAPYPGEKQEEKFPGKMNLPEDVIRSCNAGAAIAHLHVRDEAGLQTINTHKFQKDLAEIKASCPIIIEGSTGGAPEHTLEERCISFTVPGVEMGSLNLGSVNMFADVYKNPIGDIRFYAQELKKKKIKPFLIFFDLSHFNYVKRLETENLISPPYVYNLVFDIPDTLSYEDKYLDIFLQEIPEDGIWFLTRHHARGYKDFLKALEKGGHVRVGYEDGPFLSSGARAKSNAELVEEIADAARLVGREVVAPDKARMIMGMNF